MTSREWNFLSVYFIRIFPLKKSFLNKLIKDFFPLIVFILFKYQRRVLCLHWRLSKQVSVQVRGVITVQDSVSLTTKLQACSL